jgi:hypothetical protein
LTKIRDLILTLMSIKKLNENGETWNEDK